MLDQFLWVHSTRYCDIFLFQYLKYQIRVGRIDDDTSLLLDQSSPSEIIGSGWFNR